MTAPPTLKLLVSVRSVAEAEAALAGGADLIDVKEPHHGALGRAADAVISAIVDHVAGRRPVSAALGELRQATAPCRLPDQRLAYVKWGLAGYGQPERDWHADLSTVVRKTEQANAAPRVVAVAYADWHVAQAPAVDDVCRFALTRPGSVLLVDTFTKAASPTSSKPRSLLDWLSPRQIVDLCQRCRSAGVHVALAGSLDLPQITELVVADPDWFAVRGAACDAGRDATVSVDRVRRLAQFLEAARAARRAD